MLMKEKDRNEAKTEEDHDEEEEERVLDEENKDEVICSGVGDIIGILAKNYREIFAPMFQAFIPKLSEMVKPTSSITDQQTAICVFDDVTEFLGQAALPYFPFFFPHALKAVLSPDPSIRQSATYGMGVCAQVGGPQLAPYIQEILSMLTQAICLPDARSKEFINPTENAISSVGKIIKFNSSSINVSQVLPIWIAWLPVTTDKTESIVTYGFLCDFLEEPATNAIIMGQTYSNLPKVLSIFGQVLGTDLINENIQQRIVNILKHMRTTFAQEILGSAWGNLTEDQRQKLQSVSQ